MARISIEETEPKYLLSIVILLLSSCDGVCLAVSRDVNTEVT